MSSFLAINITYLLIGANLLISYLGFKDRYFVDKYIFSKRRVLENKQYYRLVTSGFLHADWGHLIFNMLTLYFFGINLEYYFQMYLDVNSGGLWDRLVFLVFYFSALIISSVPDLIKKNGAQYSLGASGAVTAVLFSSILFSPFSTIYIYFIPMPSLLFAVLYILYTANAERMGWQSGVNHSAHLWGAVYGLVFTVLFFPTSLINFMEEVRLILSSF